MKKHGLTALVCAIVLVLSCVGCSPSDTAAGPVQADIDVQQAEFEEITQPSADGVVTVALKGSTAEISGGDGCRADGSSVTITKEGTYRLSGTLEGQIIVDADGEKVRLVLDGAHITCHDSSPLYIKDGKKVTVTLAEGSDNTLTDGSSWVYDDPTAEEPNAALFSKADLILEGEGRLTVNATFNNGIQSKDSLEIHSGTYIVNAVNHGIIGKDSLAVKSGSFTITAGGDGMRSTNSDDVSMGWISLSGGTFAINAGQDGIQAESTMYIGGGDFTITTGGGSANSSYSSEWGSWEQGNNLPHSGWGVPGRSRSADRSAGSSAKGIKAGSDVLIEDGSIDIDSSDDAMHSNGDLSITGGSISISSGDDGIHADAALVISGGEIIISKSYEGIEGVSVAVSGGTIDLISADDGINSAGGSDGDNHRPGANMFAADSSCDVTLSGGSVTIDAAGDGIDSNGSLHINGGMLIISGPTNGANSSLDYTGECIITAGTVAVAGSSGMVQGMSSASTQGNMLLCFSSTVPGGTSVALTDKNGSIVIAFTPEKDYSSVLVSVSSMKVGDTYKLWLGGSYEGDGICTSGILSGASEVAEVTLSQISTNYGGTGGPGPGR